MRQFSHAGQLDRHKAEEGGGSLGRRTDRALHLLHPPRHQLFKTGEPHASDRLLETAQSEDDFVSTGERFIVLMTNGPKKTRAIIRQLMPYTSLPFYIFVY